MDQKDEVKSKVDLVEVVSSYLPLKKAGRNFAGLCPFHSEKTPSFMVSSERQVFKCFGCGESGDVFTFLEKVEGWDFREALEELANKVGVKLTKFTPSGKSQQKERLVEINNLVSKFYSYILEKHALGENARKYLKKRGITDKTWKKFGVGFAPVGWENTFKFLTKRKFSAADIASAGLIVAKQRRAGQEYFDRFRNRLMFPLCDSRGTILGFAGRLIDPPSHKVFDPEVFDREAQTESAQTRRASEGEAKYINSPETPIFNKGSLLFGLDLARKSIRDKNEAVLVEGEFDVMSASQIGVENVVASKGTALTEKQVVVLSRLCENVVLSFDEDVAGDAAARRGIELLDVAGMQVKVVRLGKHKDPDEFSQKDASGFKNALKNSENIYDYFIDSAIARFDAKSAEGKKKIGSEVLPVLAKISDDLVRAHYIDRLAKVLELDVNLVAGAVEKKIVSPLALVEITSSETIKKADDVERFFLALYIFQDEISKQALRFLLPDDFESTEARVLWKWLRDIIVTLNSPTVKKVIGRAPARFKDFVDDLYLVNISPVFADREIWAGELAKIANRIKKAAIKRKLVEISEEIKSAERSKEPKRIESLTKKFDEMSKTLKEKSL